ncbi:MAG: hypothetical protein WC889_15775, partial [Myxococcota bacterium]
MKTFGIFLMTIAALGVLPARAVEQQPEAGDEVADAPVTIKIKETRFGLGVEAGLLFFESQSAYNGKGFSIIQNLGGSSSGSHKADWAVVPVLIQSW